jgi:outer membrane protein
MKPGIRAATVALMLVGLTGLAAAQAAVPRVAFVNGRELLNGAPGRAEAQATLDREVAQFDASVKRLGDTVQAKQRRYQQEEASLSPAVREQRQKDINDSMEKYQRTRDSLENVVQRRQADLFQPILDLVNKVLADVRAEDGYSVIFDISAPGAGIVAFDKNLDITDKILPRVKRQPKPPIPGAPAAGAAGVTRPPPPPAR